MNTHGGLLARIIGHGPHKVICLHGWLNSATGWGPFTQWLDGERYTYAFMDCRGYGARMDVPGEYTMAEIASDVLALADHMGWWDFSLVGHSMGGMAIQRVLLEAPDRVRRLVGITPVPACGVPFDEPSWEFFNSAPASPEVRRAIIDLTTGSRLSGVWLDAMVRHSQANTRAEAVSAYLQSWACTDFSAQVYGLQHPVLVLVGAHDPALNEAYIRATWMEAYPHAHIEILLNAGHYPMYETPVALATAMERFLAD